MTHWQIAKVNSRNTQRLKILHFQYSKAVCKFFTHRKKDSALSDNLYTMNNSRSPNKQLKPENPEGAHFARFLVLGLQYKLTYIQCDKCYSVGFNLITPNLYQSESKIFFFNFPKEIKYFPVQKHQVFNRFFIHIVFQRCPQIYLKPHILAELHTEIQRKLISELYQKKKK